MSKRSGKSAFKSKRPSRDSASTSSKKPRATRELSLSASPPLDPQWLRVRESLLKHIKERVRRRLGAEPDAIRAYARRWERELRAPWELSSKRDLVAKVEEADLVFGGDFHAFSQAQRTHLKILKALSGKRKLVIALEAFAPRHQGLLDRYVRGEIDEAELLRRSRWKSHWGFPWENYRPLMEFARQNHHGILAVGSHSRDETLKEREAAAALSLRRFYEGKANSNTLVYMVFGDLHLASRHLPRLVDKVLGELAPRRVTIHLNSEWLYFELARRGMEADVDVLRLGPNRFCVLASPPWVQWQSYLMYLENSQDSGLGGDESGGFEWTERVAGFVRLAAQDFDLDLRGDDLVVFTAGDNRLWPKLRASLSAKELRLARHCIQEGHSFYLPAGRLCFLARPTINHAVELAGYSIHGHLSGLTRPLWKLPRDFRALCWFEAVGFFFSKLINHKRHAETLIDLKMRLAVTSPQDQGRDALIIALEQRFSELLLLRHGRERAARFRPRRSASWLEAARILGGMMGERLYLAYRSRKISKRTLLSLLRKDPSDANFAQTYEAIVRRLGPGTGASRTRRERL